MVTVVGDGVAAVKALTDNEFDIVLLDIRMPLMDGFDACRAIRDLEYGKNVPILMLTGQDDTDSKKWPSKWVPPILSPNRSTSC